MDIDSDLNYPPLNILIATSTIGDGTMLDRTTSTHDPQIVANRQKFCQKNNINYSDAVYQRIVYADTRTYQLIAEVDEGSTTKVTPEVAADALFTRSKGVALMLPVADCVATVVYDPTTEALALLHLGRHSTLTPLLGRTIRKMVYEGADASKIIIWMSPSAQASGYVMDYFDRADDPDWQKFCKLENDGYHLDLQGYNRQVCLENGLAKDNIYISTIDTITSQNYFSHSAGDANGRFVVMAMMRP